MLLFAAQLPAQFGVQFREDAFLAHAVQDLGDLEHLLVVQLFVAGNVPELGPGHIEADLLLRHLVGDHVAHDLAVVGEADHVLVHQRDGELALLVRVFVNDLLHVFLVDLNLDNGFRLLLGRFLNGLELRDAALVVG